MTSKRQRFCPFAEVINVYLEFGHQPATEKNTWFTSATSATSWNVKDVRPDQKMLTTTSRQSRTAHQVWLLLPDFNWSAELKIRRVNFT